MEILLNVMEEKDDSIVTLAAGALSWCSCARKYESNLV